jgi:hypothetical protein
MADGQAVPRLLDLARTLTPASVMKSVFPVAEAFGVEDLIDPRDTRPLLIRYLEAAIPRLAHDLGPKPATESGPERAGFRRS